MLPNSASFWGVGDGLTSPVAPCARTSWVPSGALWRSSAWLPSNRGRWCQRNRRRTPRWKTNVQGSSGFLAICLWYSLNLFDMFQSLKHTRKAIKKGSFSSSFLTLKGLAEIQTLIAHCIVFRYLQMLQGKTCSGVSMGFFPRNLRWETPERKLALFHSTNLSGLGVPTMNEDMEQINKATASTNY